MTIEEKTKLFESLTIEEKAELTRKLNPSLILLTACVTGTNTIRSFMNMVEKRSDLDANVYNKIVSAVDNLSNTITSINVMLGDAENNIIKEFQKNKKASEKCGCEVKTAEVVSEPESEEDKCECEHED